MLFNFWRLFFVVQFCALSLRPHVLFWRLMKCSVKFGYFYLLTITITIKPDLPMPKSNPTNLGSITLHPCNHALTNARPSLPITKFPIWPHLAYTELDYIILLLSVRLWGKSKAGRFIFILFQVKITVSYFHEKTDISSYNSIACFHNKVYIWGI